MVTKMNLSALKRVYKKFFVKNETVKQDQPKLYRMDDIEWISYKWYNFGKPCYVSFIFYWYYSHTRRNETKEQHLGLIKRRERREREREKGRERERERERRKKKKREC